MFLPPMVMLPLKRFQEETEEKIRKFFKAAYVPQLQLLNRRAAYALICNRYGF